VDVPVHQVDMKKVLTLKGRPGVYKVLRGEIKVKIV